MVGKRSLLQRRSTVKLAGAQRSANAGMSNRITGENPVRRKTKVSSAMTISWGLVGPKSNPRGVDDGKLVNIPALRHGFLQMTQFSSMGGAMICRLWPDERRAVCSFVLAQSNPYEQVAKKILQKSTISDPYRKPTQVVWHQCAKANKWNLVKELGKKAAVT